MKIVLDWRYKKISLEEALEMSHMSKSTFYRRLHEGKILQ